MVVCAAFFINFYAVMSTFKKSKREDTDNNTESGEGISGRDSMGRRIWDTDYFKGKYETSINAEPPKKLIKGATEALKQRTEDLKIDEQVSQKRLVTNASGKTQQGGFYCEICDCLLRDSRAYLDHVNGRSHNRMLGMTMNVEAVTVERVIEKMKRIKAGLE